MSTPPSPTVVVWWPAQRRPGDRLPRGQLIGWSTPDATHHGEHWVINPLRQLTHDVVDHQLGTALRPVLGKVHTEPLNSSDQHHPEVELLAAGHIIRDTDLHHTYGLDVVAGITASLDSLTTHFTVVFERTLSRPVRSATAHLALTTIADFPPRDSADRLVAAGWWPTRSQRWQILLIQ